jgi:hypothetical protein
VGVHPKEDVAKFGYELNMKAEHQIVNIILYISHMYRNVVNFLKIMAIGNLLRHLILAGLILRF